jgi:hypothetical protein
MARIPVVTRDQISEKEKHHERLQHVEAATLQRLSSTSRAVARNCLTPIGFPWKPSNPAAMIRVRSWVITEPVIAMTEVELVTGSARSRCRASTH